MSGTLKGGKPRGAASLSSRATPLKIPVTPAHQQEPDQKTTPLLQRGIALDTRQRAKSRQSGGLWCPGAGMSIGSDTARQYESAWREDHGDPSEITLCRTAGLTRGWHRLAPCRSCAVKRHHT